MDVSTIIPGVVVPRITYDVMPLCEHSVMVGAYQERQRVGECIKDALTRLDVIKADLNWYQLVRQYNADQQAHGVQAFLKILVDEVFNPEN